MMVFIVCDRTGTPVRAFSSLRAAEYFIKYRVRPDEYKIINLPVD